MFRYYKNLVNFSSMFSLPENGGGSNLQQEKQKLIDAVNSIALTQEQLNKIKQKLILNGKTIDNFTLQNWKDKEINLVNNIANLEESNLLQQKYTKLQNEITEKSDENRTKLEKEIPLIKTENSKIIKNNSVFSQKPSSLSQSKTSETLPTTPEKSTNINIQIKLDWVKKSLNGHFNDINNPTKEDILKILKNFEDFDKMKKEPGSSAKVVFAIQVALNFLGIPVTVDGLLGPDTKKAIAQFQKEKMLLNRTNRNPGPKTIKSLIEKLEALK